MKKIGIITLNKVMNFGAFLQAYALQSFLEGIGYHVSIINLENRKTYERFMLIKCKYPRRVIYNLKTIKKYDEVWKQLKVVNREVCECDVVVIGSDELWNVENFGFIHRPEYFGDNINVSNILTYAVSANTVTPDKFREITKGSVDFRSIQRISVRDRFTKALVKAVCNREAELVLDPTFLMKDWGKYAVPCSEKNFILLYSFTVYDDEKKKILAFARRTGKKLISVGSMNPWCDEDLCISPFEFLGYMLAADYVITSSFHGTVFSMIMEKNFVVFPQHKNKILDLMNRFDIENRDVTNVDDLSDVYKRAINYTHINRLRDTLAEQSMNWLVNAIENE